MKQEETEGRMRGMDKVWVRRLPCNIDKEKKQQREEK